METNNLENQLKSKLKQRELSPSQQSWSKLSQRLDTFENNKKKTSYWWLAIAASVVLALFAGFSVLNTKTQEAIPNAIVKNPSQESDMIESQLSEGFVKDSDAVLVENQMENLVEQKINRVTHEHTTKQPEITNTSIVVAQENAQETKKNESQLDYEAQKLLEVVAQIKQLNEQNNHVTEAEVDSLLKAAQNEIFKQKLINETTKTVDANALLLEVEDELNGSFKAKVYEALKSGFISVKTAVAERKN